MFICTKVTSVGQFSQVPIRGIVEKYLVTILRYFSYFSIKIYVVGTHKKCLGKALLMSIHNIYFHGKLEKIIPLLITKHSSLIILLPITCFHGKISKISTLPIQDKNSAEGVIAPAGAKVTRATIRMWLLNKFISFLAVLSWKTGLKKM